MLNTSFNQINILLCLMLAFVSCTQKEKRASISNENKDSVVRRLWMEASQAEFYSKFTHSPTDSLLKALTLLDEATNFDTICISCYDEKVIVYAKLKKYDLAIKVLDTICMINSLNGFDCENVLKSQGNIYEKANDLNKANKKYAELTTYYRKKQVADPGNLRVKVDLAYLSLFTKSKDEAIAEMKKIILENQASNDTLNLQIDIFEKFDREKFIANIYE